MRLFPKFTLRFAMIALTIFLLVFGTVVNYWQRYQAHERSTMRLQEQQCEVEEESVTFLGFEIGKRLTGIDVNPQGEMNYLQLLGQVPRPQDLRRFAFQDAIFNQESIDRLLSAIGRFSELEELYLRNLTLTTEQVEQLGKLTHLRVLDLAECNLPPNSIGVLESMPDLESLRLVRTKWNLAELQKLDLPRLRVIEMSETSLAELQLTQTGWGRFPLLETLILRDNNLDGIVCTPGSMPRLKHLDLGSLWHKCRIDWRDWPEAMPELTMLVVPTPWLEPEMIPILAKFPRLRYVYLESGEPSMRSSIEEFSVLEVAELEHRVPARLVSAMKVFVGQRPDVLFSGDFSAVYQMVSPKTYQTSKSWSSPNWRANPHNVGGGFF